MKSQPLISVRDVQKSAAFYCALLGAQPGHGGDKYEQILIGNELILQLHTHEGDEHHESFFDDASLPGNGIVLWFETGDFPALLDRVQRHDIALDRPAVENPFARQMECWLHDPDGYQVVIAGPSAYPRVALTDRDQEEA